MSSHKLNQAAATDIEHLFEYDINNNTEIMHKLRSENLSSSLSK